MKKMRLANPTAKAIPVVAVCAIIQATLLFYSVSHPSANDLVATSFLFVIVFYPAVFEYHTRKIKISRRRSSESPLDSD